MNWHEISASVSTDFPERPAPSRCNTDAIRTDIDAVAESHRWMRHEAGGRATVDPSI